MYDTSVAAGEGLIRGAFLGWAVGAWMAGGIMVLLVVGRPASPIWGRIRSRLHRAWAFVSVLAVAALVGYFSFVFPREQELGSGIPMIDLGKLKPDPRRPGGFIQR